MIYVIFKYILYLARGFVKKFGGTRRYLPELKQHFFGVIHKQFGKTVQRLLFAVQERKMPI